MSSHEGSYLTIHRLTERRRQALVARRRRRRRVTACAIAILAVALAAIAVLLGSTGAKPYPAHALHAAALQLAAPDFRFAGPGGGASADDRAITRVMAYTPYVSAGGRRHREIALTFDDGPGPYTFAVLRQLRRLHVPATFFEVGQMLPYFPAAARAVHRRYPVGDHTLSHPAMAALSPAAQRTQVLEDAVRLRDFHNPFPRLFRPPYASFDAATVALVRRYRMLMVLWSIDSEDYTRPGTQQIVRNVVSHAKPGAIVLMHDAGGPREQTIAAIPTIVRTLRRRGYRFVTVPRMMADAPPPRRQKLPPHAGPGG